MNTMECYIENKTANELDVEYYIQQERCGIFCLLIVHRYRIKSHYTMQVRLNTCQQKRKTLPNL